MDEPIQITKTCNICGNEFVPHIPASGKRGNAYYYCKPCLRKRDAEEYARRAEREGRNKNTPRNVPVEVVGIDPTLKCQELRNDLRICFWGSRFVLEDFRRSVQEGCVDGLLVEHAGQRYAVRRGEMVMVQEGG